MVQRLRRCPLSLPRRANQHRIKVEKTLPTDAHHPQPLSIAGANATPPYHCGGGVYRYYDFAVAVSDSNHPEHAEMTDWIGRSWAPAAFDLDAANFRLKTFL